MEISDGIHAINIVLEEMSKLVSLSEWSPRISEKDGQRQFETGHSRGNRRLGIWSMWRIVLNRSSISCKLGKSAKSEESSKEAKLPYAGHISDVSTGPIMSKHLGDATAEVEVTSTAPSR